MWYGLSNQLHRRPLPPVAPSSGSRSLHVDQPGTQNDGVDTLKLSGGSPPTGPGPPLRATEGPVVHRFNEHRSGPSKKCRQTGRAPQAVPLEGLSGPYVFFRVLVEGVQSILPSIHERSRNGNRTGAAVQRMATVKEVVTAAGRNERNLPVHRFFTAG